MQFAIQAQKPQVIEPHEKPLCCVRSAQEAELFQIFLGNREMRYRASMASWTKAESALLSSLQTPSKIQAFLDAIPYNTDEITRSPRGVMQTKRAHCFDGALFAAAALEQHGEKPLIVDLRTNGEDDDHVLAIFRVGRHYGAIAKSNFASLRYREPVYRSLRELALSYFNNYINLERTRTLREYSALIDLSRVRTVDWRRTDNDLSDLSDTLDRARHFPLLTDWMERTLVKADERLLKAEMVGIDLRGAYKPK